MSCLVHTSLMAGAVVLPTLALSRQYQRLALYGTLTALSYLNHSGRHPPAVAYADRVVALTCVVELWQRTSERERRSLLLGISLYLLRHATKNVSYHAAAHLVFATTAALNSLQETKARRLPPNSVVALCIAVLALLPTGDTISSQR